jgi:hypothetical protein
MLAYGMPVCLSADGSRVIAEDCWVGGVIVALTDVFVVMSLVAVVLLNDIGGCIVVGVCWGVSRLMRRST